MSSRSYVRPTLTLALAAAPLVALACGAAAPPSQPSIALPLPPADAASDVTEADARAAQATHASTCARDYTPRRPAKTLDPAELQRWKQLADDADASARDRAHAELARGYLYFEAERLDDALAILGPLVREGSPDVAMNAMEPYLAGLVQAGPPCRTQLESDVPNVRRRLCVASQDDRCERLEVIEFEVRSSSALFLAETDPTTAATSYEKLFQDMCRPAKPKMRCDEIVYNAAILWARVGERGKAQAMLAVLKDKRNGLDRSPLVAKLECMLSGKDGGAC